MGPVRSAWWRLRGRMARAPRSSGPRRRALFVLVGMISGSLALSALFGQRGVLELARYRAERERLLHEIAELQAQVTALELETRALQQDPLAVERIAREELVLARPGEIVVLLPRDAPRDPRQAGVAVGGPGAASPPR